MKGLAMLGALQDLGGGPFLVQHPDEKNNEEFLADHWAALCEVLERHWREGNHE